MLVTVLVAIAVRVITTAVVTLLAILFFAFLFPAILILGVLLGAPAFFSSFIPARIVATSFGCNNAARSESDRGDGTIQSDAIESNHMSAPFGAPNAANTLRVS
jgi:hypothetical protein